MDDRELALREEYEQDFSLYARDCLVIRTKGAALQPLFMNRAQRYLHDRLERQLREKGRVRALVLKGRQVGISTYIGARFYRKVSHNKGLNAFIVAHLEAASDNLFKMAKRYHDNCPELFRPETGKANAKEMNFSRLDSGYKVATAGSAEIGRSETIQCFHGSEVAFWPNADAHSAGIQQAIANAPGTEDIRESTANGLGNAFYREWQAAERGDSQFEAIFIPWYWHEEYATTLHDAELPEDWAVSEEWLEYQQLYELTEEQLIWAWVKNRELATASGGQIDEPCWKFKQEYPANAAEAFQTSGEASFIVPRLVLAARKRKDIPAYGPIILGVDPARGGGDKTGLVDRQGRVMGANVCELVDYDNLMHLAGYIKKVAVRIGAAKVVVDTTNMQGLTDRLAETLGADMVEGVNFGAGAYDREAFANRRIEMWHDMMRWFWDETGVWVPDRDDLQTDICAPVIGKGATHNRSNGQLILEAKDHIIERLGHSPDLGDAAALTFGIDMADAVQQQVGNEIYNM
ncbi:MAG: hypothetical protein GDA50_04165 [Alphaproteobacteria bacterium GM202ARS2]|nr:hypothetical protein [Alphaproteobacteria bacterium GM202ARS2]